MANAKECGDRRAHDVCSAAVAIAAIPSWRPVNPNRSLVVAFTLMRVGSMSIIFARLACMAAACGPILGNSQIIVQSMLPIAKL